MRALAVLLLRLPFRILHRLLFICASYLAAATGTTLALLATSALLLAVNFATLTSTAVFGALSKVVERVFDGGVRKEHMNETTRLRAETAEARRALATSERSLSRSRAETARLDDDLRARRVEADRLRGQVEAQRSRTGDVARRIKVRAANVATVNAGSMLGEAVPFIGVGVIAAATAFELKAACDTMRDMDELIGLSGALPASGASDSTDTYKVCGMEVPDPAIIWAQVAQSPSTAWRLTQEGWAEAASRIPEDLPDIPGPPIQAEFLERLERLRQWIWGSFENPWATRPAH